MACGTRHLLNKNVHGFRQYRGVVLCCDCYGIPEIAHEIQAVWTLVFWADRQQNATDCALCQVPLIDPVTLQPRRAFERDHLNVFTKISTVWALVMTGATLFDILSERDKCRNLCVRCHAAVTCAERTLGILALKAIDRTGGLSTDMKTRAQQQVETLTQMLLGLETGSMSYSMDVTLPVLAGDELEPLCLP
jgi:hypothetical protein